MNTLETVYKLTDIHSRTRPGHYNECQGGKGITHSASGKGPLCTESWIHAYSHPLIAVLMNPVHACYSPALLWKCRAEVGIRNADKLGCRILTTIDQLDLPVVTTTQRCAFAVLVAKQVYKDAAFNKWAEGWLSGKDRTEAAASAAASAAAWAEASAARAAARAAAGAEKLDLISIAKEAVANY